MHSHFAKPEGNVANAIHKDLEISWLYRPTKRHEKEGTAMAHEVGVKLHTKSIANKDLEIEVKTLDQEGRSSKLGTLLISKGKIEWLPKGNSVNKNSLTWVRFAQIMEDV